MLSEDTQTKKMKKQVRYLIIFIVGWILFWLVILASQVFGSIDYPPGECWEWNEEEFCCVNCTEEYEIINYTNQVDIDIDLTCGEQLESTQENCNYKFTCGNITAGPSVCSITKTMEAGTDYSILNSACDLYFECGEAAEPVEIVHKIYDIPYAATYNNNTELIELIINNQTISIPVGGYFSYSNIIQYECPIAIINKTDESDWLLEECKEYLPYFYTMDEITKTLLAGREKSDKRFQKCQEEKEQLIKDRSGKVLVDNQMRVNEITEVTECYNDLRLQKNFTESENFKRLVCDRDLKSCDGGQSVFIGIIVIMGGFIIYCVINILNRKRIGGLS